MSRPAQRKQLVVRKEALHFQIQDPSIHRPHLNQVKLDSWLKIRIPDASLLFLIQGYHFLKIGIYIVCCY